MTELERSDNTPTRHGGATAAFEILHDSGITKPICQSEIRLRTYLSVTGVIVLAVMRKSLEAKLWTSLLSYARAAKIRTSAETIPPDLSFTADVIECPSEGLGAERKSLAAVGRNDTVLT